MYQENAPRPMSDPQSSQSDLAVAPSRPSRPSHHSLVGSAQAQSPESSQLGGLLLQLQLGTLQHAGCQLVVLEPRCDASRHWTQARTQALQPTPTPSKLRRGKGKEPKASQLDSFSVASCHGRQPGQPGHVPHRNPMALAWLTTRCAVPGRPPYMAEKPLEPERRRRRRRRRRRKLSGDRRHRCWKRGVEGR